MKSLVVYESFYGNTELIAQAIAAGLARHGEARSVGMGAVEASSLSDVDVLVVGAPTHAWGLPRAKTRAGIESAVALDGQPLVRQWLETVPDGGGRAAAAFATRLDKPRVLTGSAAGGIARRLRHRGWSRPTSKSFVVTGTQGPLAAGEIEKAATWGDELGARAAAALPAKGGRQP